MTEIRYDAELKRVIDGDTLVFNVHFNLLQYDLILENVEVRLSGVDTHEIYFVEKSSEEYQKGIVEKQFVENWCSRGKDKWKGRFPFIVEVQGQDVQGKYGRIIGDVYRRDNSESLVSILKDNYKGIDYE